jgi:hypothetical protein
MFMTYIHTGASPDSALPETDPEDRTERELRKLEELSNRTINVVRTLHRRPQRPADAPEPTPAEARELRETAALLLRAVREARQIVESEARIVATVESLAIRRDKLHHSAKSRRVADMARATRNRRTIRENLHTAIVIECPVEQIQPMHEKLGHILAELTTEDLVYRTVEENIARIRHALDMVDRQFKSDLTRWPTPGNEVRPP